MKITAWEIELDKLTKSGYEKSVDDLNNTPAHMLDIGNPNHPTNDGIFGYETSDFINKQYK